MKGWSRRCNTNCRGRQGLITPVCNFRLGSESEGSLFTCIYLWFNQWARVQAFRFVSEHARSNTCEKGGGEKKRVPWKGKDSQVSQNPEEVLTWKEDVTPNFWLFPEMLVCRLLSSQQRLFTLMWAVPLSFLGHRLLLPLGQVMQFLKRAAFFRFTPGTSWNKEVFFWRAAPAEKLPAFQLPTFPGNCGSGQYLAQMHTGLPVRALAQQDHACASKAAFSLWSQQHSGSPRLCYCVCSCSQHADKKYRFSECRLFFVSITKIYLCKYAVIFIIYQTARQWELRSLQALNLGSLLDHWWSMGEQQVRNALLQNLLR